MGLLDGKVAIITGGGHGLGRSHCLAFAREGAKVVVNDPGVQRDGSGGSHQSADRVVQEIQELGGEAVPNYSSVATRGGAESILQTALDHFGRVDILVNNAGILRDKTLLKMEESWWDDVLAVHLKGTFLMTQLVGRVLKEQGDGGRIINTTSYAGLKGNFGQANYAAAKAGIYGLTLVAALEFQKFGVLVNAIAPMAKTRMTKDIVVIPPEMKAEHVSPMVIFLASSLSEGITGRVFGVHGTHIFEYKMEMTEGVKKDSPWTPQEIKEALPEISGSSKVKSQDSKEDAKKEWQKELEEIFQALPKFYQKEEFPDWKACFHFKISGTDPWTMSIEDGKCSVQKGLEGKATCVVESDLETLYQIFTGKIKGEQAFMEGKIKATNIADMMKFGQAFPKNKAEAGVEKEKPEPSQSKLNPAYLGRFYRSKPYLITKEVSLAYSEATKDPNPLYQEGKWPLTPPLLAVRYWTELMFSILKDPDLGANLLRLVHGEQDMRFHRPLRVGDLLCPRSTITQIEEKSSGEIITLRMEHYVEGELAVEADELMFIRGEKKEEKDKSSENEDKEEKKKTWEPPKDIEDFSFEISVDPDQPIRYGHASLDRNPIHMDPEIAKQAGLPGNILQGLCTMAFASQAVVQNACQGDPSRLKRLKGRFSYFVLPGDQLKVKGYLMETQENLKIYSFGVQNQQSQWVITHGLAEVGR